MRSLNRTYRGLDRPTDVLSFSQLEGQGTAARKLLGDVVISWGAARRQAGEFGHALDVEMKRLLVHGILHLLGYDHEAGEDEAGEMREMEERYLKGSD